MPHLNVQKSNYSLSRCFLTHTHTHTHIYTHARAHTHSSCHCFSTYPFIRPPVRLFICSQSFICTLLAVCLSLSFFRHPHLQSERLLYRLQYFCQPAVLGFAKQIEHTASSCTVQSYYRPALCNAYLWGPFITLD